MQWKTYLAQPSTRRDRRLVPDGYLSWEEYQTGVCLLSDSRHRLPLFFHLLKTIGSGIEKWKQGHAHQSSVTFRLVTTEFDRCEGILGEVLRKVSTVYVWSMLTRFIQTAIQTVRCGANRAYAWLIADYAKKANVYSTAYMYYCHPHGHHLANGAYKEVFKVFSSQKCRLEAISVMDISAIEAAGKLSVVCQEVAHSLLNFFLKDIGRADLRKDPGSNIVLHYLLEDVCFVFQMPASFSYWVKLADFGAADSNPENLGSPVTIDQFTTLENTPVEFLLEGDAAKQSYAADTFLFGPLRATLVYWMNFLNDLKFIWMSPRKNSGFSVIKSVARGDDENTLCHSLYRFVVLFGLPMQNPNERNGIDKVWQLLLKHLRPDDPALSHPQRRPRRTRGAGVAERHAKSTKSQFDYDQSLYSVARGSNNVIRRCREGLQTIPGAMDLLNRMVDFDPAKRPTLKQVMYHPIFSSFRVSPSKEKRNATRLCC
ncbi:unnamed protein product [Peronospora belbahrii]|uniref:Protein kinase domain-containing protein n=1 Tax=Peronospora belbahrii TaxID=622444 RepID=A0AAU9L3C1_9STRA|nr:unnamed protein product [Peronospora belbahrii]